MGAHGEPVEPFAPSGRFKISRFQVQNFNAGFQSTFRCFENSVAVGTALADGPPHGSGRAGLPHPALALGFDAHADRGTRMMQFTPFLHPRVTYPLQRAGQGLPALSPEPVTLERLPLSQSLSLHHLRGLSVGLVRRPRWYHETVRLPVPVHHRCTSFRLFDAVCVSRTDSHGISRLPLKVLASMLRVSDRAESKGVSRLRRLQSCLPLISTASAPRSNPRLRGGVSISRLNGWPARPPVNASPGPLRSPAHDSEPVWFATPSLYETFIQNTLPAFTGAFRN